MKRKEISTRTHIGPLDSIVDFYAAKSPLPARLFKANVVRMILIYLRTGIPALANAMNIVLPEDWTDKQFIAAQKTYIKNGEEWRNARSCLQAVRQHLRHPTTKGLPLAGKSKLLEFIIKALVNGCSDDWWNGGSTQQGYEDAKNTTLLITRYFTMSEDHIGSGYTWLADRAVYPSARVEFGGLFSRVEGKPFDYADGITEKPDNGDYVSLDDTVTASGFRSLSNVHMLMGKSQRAESKYESKLQKIRILVEEVAGIMGPADTVALPGPVFRAARHFIGVSCDW